VVLLALVLTSFLAQAQSAAVPVGRILRLLPAGVLVIFSARACGTCWELGNLPLLATVREQRENIGGDCPDRRTAVRRAHRRASSPSNAPSTSSKPSNRDIVDCVATPEMLETIFFPTTPSIDARVIIRGRPDCLCGLASSH